MANKYKNRKFKKKQAPWRWIAPVITVVALGIILLLIFSEQLSDQLSGNSSNKDNGQIESIEDTISLENGLEIIHLAPYAGIYMEDGSNEIVSNMMMVVLKNTTEKDLQYAQIFLTFSDFTAQFDVTNLPAGASVVLLEKNRHEMVDETPSNVNTQNLVFFQEPMSCMEDQLKITGMDGALNVKNISGIDIDGDIYIYYKNSATDLYYGGITYRVKINGLKAGELKQAATGHYQEGNCTIMMVTVTR